MLTQSIALVDAEPTIAVIGMILASIFGIYLVAHVIGFVFGALGALVGFVGGIIGRVGLFAGKEIQDALHLAGGILTGVVIAPLAVGNAAIGRFSHAAHYGRALRTETLGAGASLYRVSLGNPLWFLGLGTVTEGLERRLPDLVAHAPSVKRPKVSRKKDGTPIFEGYRVVDELEAGGSGARLFRAVPSDKTLAHYLDSGHANPGQVVLKFFEVGRGSTVPQIVRESRSLEAARSLGLVLDHHLDEESFWYAMPFVPGEDLDVVTRRLHARSDKDGLDDAGLQRALGFASDLLASLSTFHSAGLWHKDIKPGNLIVSDERAHLVDLGLVTPLASAMTLTTHGTEYFRDPELVRRAMDGARVQDVDGVKFDLYSAGAVLYSILENSFPAHGNLSRIERRCPPALAMIVRRAMADLNQRYSSAEEMSRDLDVMLAADDLWAVKPAQLPSLSGSPASRPKARRAAFVGAAHQPSMDSETSDPGEPPVAPEVLTPNKPGAGAFGWVLRAALFMLMMGGVSVLARTRNSWSHAEPLPQPAAKWVDLSGDGDQGSITFRENARRASRDAVTLSGQGRVLTLCAPGLAAEHPEVLLLHETLREKGHVVVNELLTPAAIDLNAGALKAAQLGNPYDPAAVERLQGFLDNSKGLDAIVWLCGGDREPVKARLLVRR